MRVPFERNFPSISSWMWDAFRRAREIEAVTRATRHMAMLERQGWSAREALRLDRINESLTAYGQQWRLLDEQHHMLEMSRQAALWDQAWRITRASSSLQLLQAFESAREVWHSSCDTFIRPAEEPGPTGRQLGLLASAAALGHAYTGFCRTTFRSLKLVDEDKPIWQALRGSVVLAEQRLQESADAVSKLPEAPGENETPSSPPQMRQLQLQHAQLLKCGDILDPVDIDELVPRSPAAGVAKRLQQTLLLLVEVNEAAKVAGFCEIFQPTTRMVKSILCLPWVAPTNQMAFGQFLDELYFIFYEGAGSNKLRFFQGTPPLVTRAECEVIWSIKVLRNKWLRHDPDRGTDSDVRRSYGDLRETLGRFSLACLPRNSAQYERIRTRLACDLEQFLQLLLNRIVAISGKIA